ncbi:helix-turn-helix domain-containing protein [Poseidonibacter lekithochrous]|uniref:helix-turn-helix domain-containing protein n=1 Tax=Poseidonibacter lekithochrous TaxID=1904463 RepID=UPI000D355E53|nr:helix-turn-helix domain-containing protein [Poseidonibacter lekithochrous]
MYNRFLYLVRNTHKYTLRVEDYARALDISTKTLTRILSKYTNRTTKVYLDEFLLIKIKRYLLDEGLTLQEIANRVDFDEITNLIKFFKKFEKRTPSEFKKATYLLNDS